ncbi:MAG: hypothetical protein JG762_1181 [Deferribacteraceae bacterium]|nr:hypothetical protein [Deferribacteraceae bacterium]
MNHSLLNEVFYSECAACGCKIKSFDYLCDDCFKNEVSFVRFVCNNCGYPLEVEASSCKNCFVPKNYSKLYVACWYEKYVREAIKNIKFKFAVKEKFFIKNILENYIKSNRFYGYDLVVPVPVSFRRRFMRFVHLSEMLAKDIALLSGIKYSNILHKHKYTKFQWQYGKKERMKNVKNSIKCKTDTLGLNILLVDDIITTGATVNECARALKEGGAKNIDCFILAKGHFR